MRRYKNPGIAHLKYKLIKEDGLTPEEASERIKEMERFTQEQHKKTKKGGVLRKKKAKLTRKKA